MTELFEAALHQDRAKRSEFVRQACAGDAALLADLESLLAEYDLSGRTLDGERLPGLEGPGTVIGPYKLLAQLGAGGMGVVYEAQQLHPIRRIVALKVLKPGMDSREIISRFEGERQALALMSHPNIAQVFDAGATDTGRPYFVMERVEGVHITRYCDSHNLALRERLELFIPVCQAIQHAHQKGIIHRDIKPSNLLVTEQDGKAVPKVIDFGIAKATGQQLTDATMATHLGTVIGTLDYMSPEQADLVTHDIDTRSDIYSLGAVLYELITGSTPLDITLVEEVDYLETLRRIREEEPAQPSVRLRRGKTTPDTARLTKLVHGELDWIVMKALEKDRSRRYETANGLVRDLERYLSGEPVEAGPPSATYRLRKVARKYRFWLAAGAVFTALLIAATAVSAWMAVRASRARQEAQAVISFLQNDLLKQASPDKQAGSDGKPDPDLKVRTLLDRAAARVAGQFNKQPQVEASIRETIGSAYDDLGAYPAAVGQLERAVSLRRRVLGPSHPDTLVAMEDLGSVYEKLGKSTEAETLDTQALAIAKRVLGPEAPHTLTLMENLTLVYQDEGKYPLAEKLLVQVLEIKKRVLGAGHPDTLDTLSNLAEAYQNEGKFGLAEEFDRQGLEISKRARGPEHPDTLSFMNNLGEAYESEGKYPAAEALLTETWSLKKRVLGPEHPDTVTTMNNLAVIYADQGKYPQAEQTEAQVLEILLRVIGPEHPHTLIAKIGLAAYCMREGKFRQAEVLYMDASATASRVLGPEHPYTLIGTGELGTIYIAEGKYAQAEAISVRVAEIDKRLRGPEHPDTLIALGRVADAYRNEKKYAQAEELFTQVAEAERRVRGPEHADRLLNLYHLAQIYQAQKKYIEAEALYTQVLEGQRRVLAGGHPRTLNTMAALAWNYLDQDKPMQAEPLLREELAVYQAKLPDSWEHFRCESLLGATLMREKKYAEAEPLLLSGYRGLLERKAVIPAPDLFILDFAKTALVQIHHTRREPGKTAADSQ